MEWHPIETVNKEEIVWIKDSFGDVYLAWWDERDQDYPWRFIEIDEILASKKTEDDFSVMPNAIREGFVEKWCEFMKPE